MSWQRLLTIVGAVESTALGLGAVAEPVVLPRSSLPPGPPRPPRADHRASGSGRGETLPEAVRPLLYVLLPLFSSASESLQISLKSSSSINHMPPNPPCLCSFWGKAYLAHSLYKDTTLLTQILDPVSIFTA